MAGFWDDGSADPINPYLGAFGGRRLTGRGRGSPAGLPWQARDVSPFTLTRERVQDELEGNPQLQRKLDANTTAEVGTDPLKRRWYQALTIDRAVATGKPLDEVVNAPDYYPGKTTGATAVTGQRPDASIWEGANPANFATGNSSYDPIKQRWVGFAGGPQTSTYGKGQGMELAGIEGGTMPYARAMGYGGPERTAIGPQGPQGDETAVAGGLLDMNNPPATYPRPEGRKMDEPKSLLDYFQATDPSGAPVDLTRALQSRSNSLIGLGMGLMSPAWQGESVMGNALKGFQSGAGLDARQQALNQSTAERKQQQANWERQFARSGESDWAKIARELQLKPGSPEYLQGAKQYYQSKTEGDWVTQTDEDTGRPYAFNKRTLETKPINIPGTAVAPAGGEGAPGAIPPAPAGADRKEWKKEQTKLAVQQRAAEEARKKQGAMIDPVTEDIDRAINQTRAYPGMVSGFFGNLMKNVPSSQANDVAKLVDTIKANSSFDKLAAMRAQSPTGASGLGAVTQGEHKLLQDSIGALDQSQTPEQFLYNLDRVKRIRHEIIHGPGTAGPPQFQTPAGQRAPGAPAGGGGGGGGDVRQLNGKTYRKVNGQWFED